jgi:tetratricopeptide (TPR) repeat protein
MGKKGVRRGGLGLALVLGCLGGCQFLPRPAPSPEPATAETVGGVKIGPREKADLQFVQGDLLRNKGQVAPALAAYTEAVQLDPSRADAALRAAALLDQQGKFAEAAEFYRKAQAAQPNNPAVACNLGYSLYLQRRYGEAEAALRQALALQPDHARAHNNLGLVLAAGGRPDEALAEFRRAGCGEADAHYNLGFALTLQRPAWPEARAQYKQAVAADGGSPAARKGLQELDALRARAEKLSASPPAAPGRQTAAAAAEQPAAPAAAGGGRPE